MSNNIKTKLKDFLEKEAQTTISGNSVDLIKKGILDSFLMIRLISFIEEEIGISVDMEKLTPENFNSLITIEKTILQWK